MDVDKVVKDLQDAANIPTSNGEAIPSPSNRRARVKVTFVLGTKYIKLMFDGYFCLYNRI